MFQAVTIQYLRWVVSGLHHSVYVVNVAHAEYNVIMVACSEALV